MYITLGDLLAGGLSELSLIELTDDTNVGVIDTAIVDAAISRAQTEVDTHLGVRFEVPFPTSGIPQQVKDITRDLAVYRLYQRRHPEAIPEGIRQTYDDAVGLLKRIAQGTAALPVAQVASIEKSPGLVATNKKAADRVYSSQELAKW